MDVFSVRMVGHGRYHGDSARWNRVISCLFISAGVAFVYWMRRESEVENTVLLIGAYVLLIMAVLAFYFQIEELKQSWLEAMISDKIDLMANCLVFVITVVGVVFRHMDHSQRDFGEVTNEMELAMVP